MLPARKDTNFGGGFTGGLPVFRGNFYGLTIVMNVNYIAAIEERIAKRYSAVLAIEIVRSTLAKRRLYGKAAAYSIAYT